VRVPAWGSYSYVYGPLVAFGMVVVLALLLRWAFRRGRSLVPSAPRSGRADDYGLLVAVAEPATFIEAEVLRQHLTAAGITATLAPTTQGPRVLVFPRDEHVARDVLRRSGGP
jgi:hypothetical protein